MSTKDEMKILTEMILKECELWKSPETIVEELGAFKIYSTPDSENIPFLNIAIPQSNEAWNFKRKDLASLKNYFSSKGRMGFIPYPGKTLSAEVNKYFSLLTSVSAKNVYTGVLLEETKDLGLFADTVKRGFGFDDSFVSSFTKRITSLSNAINSRLFLLKIGKEVIGCNSYFQRNGASTWFMMNSCILNEYRRAGHGKLLINESIQLLDSYEVYVRTSNSNMAKLLKVTGFEKVGDVFLVPLRE